MAIGYSVRGAPTIRRFMDSNAFVRGLVGPLGGGKSSGCVWEVAQRGVMQKPGPDGIRRSRWCVIRNTNRQLEDSTIRTVTQWFPPHIHGDWRPSKNNYVIRSLRAGPNEPPAEIELQFRALDRPDQVGNLLSTEYTGGWINEGREVPWAVFEALMGRVGRYPARRDGGATWRGVISDTNAPDTDSEWYRFFEESDHSESVARLNKVLKERGLPLMGVQDYAMCFMQPDGMSPEAENLEHLEPGYYERLAIGKSEDWIKVYIRGQYGFTVSGRPVFGEYIDHVHCPESPEAQPRTVKDTPILRSFDFGLTPACVWSQLTPSGQWVVVDEMWANDMGFDEFSDQVLEHSERHYRGAEFEDVGDPAGQQRSQSDTKTCFEIGRAKGLMIQPAPQTLRLRLEATRKPMRTLRNGKPQFLLHPRCRRLRKALLGGYHYRRKNVPGEVYTPEPEKDMYSHVADALTYAGAWLFGGSIRGFDAAAADDFSPWRAGSDRTRSRVTGY